MSGLLPGLAATAYAGSRLSGSLGAGAAYDDAALLEAKSPSAAGSLERFELGWRARALSDLTLHAQFLYSGFEAFGTPIASNRDEYLSLAGDWRFLDSLSLTLHGEAESNQFPSSALLDFNRFRGAPGLAWSPLAGSLLSAAALFEQFKTPAYDLDHDSSGFEAALSQDLPWGLRLSADAWSLDSAYSKRFLLSPRSNQNSTAHRFDQSWAAQACLGWAADDGSASLSLGWRAENLRSNGNADDFGPFQSVYTDVTFYDNTQIDDFYSMGRKGPQASAWWQALPWLRFSGRGWLSSADWVKRPAKDAGDRFIAGLPPRHDDWLDAQAALDFYFGFLGQDFRMELSVLRQQSASNDALYNFTRHFSQALLNLDF